MGDQTHHTSVEMMQVCRSPPRLRIAARTYLTLSQWELFAGRSERSHCERPPRSRQRCYGPSGKWRRGIETEIVDRTRGFGRVAVTRRQCDALGNE